MTVYRLTALDPDTGDHLDVMPDVPWNLVGYAAAELRERHPGCCHLVEPMWPTETWGTP